MAITWKQIKETLGDHCPAGPDAIRFYLESIQAVLFCQDGKPFDDDCVLFKELSEEKSGSPDVQAGLR
jgi:hypothetical protein